MRLTGSLDEPELAFLPWRTPLEEWPEDLVVALPRGISRHIVRFVRLNGVVYAVKEVEEHYATREYELLFDLVRRGLPTVEPVGVVLDRSTDDGEPLPAGLITRHLEFSLPYRALFSSSLRLETAHRLLDALAVLLVQLHLAGFSWNDCSLSNTLFRRDAGAFAAYLVDAETGELHPTLSNGQRTYDLETAATNVAGELMDLQVSTEADGEHITVAPKVVDAGHHSRRLMQLTGLDVEENQAQRLLNDLDSFRIKVGLGREDEEIAAHRWVTERFERVMSEVPPAMRGKLEPAQIFHEVLEHRWFMSEREGCSVPFEDSISDYVTTILAAKPDEQAVLGARAGSPSDDTASLRIVLPPEIDE